MSDWEKIYKRKGRSHKNEWPSEDIVKIFNIFKLKRKISFLAEIGSGWGNNLRFFQKEKINYVGIESSLTASNYCKKSKFNVIHDNYLNIEFRNNSIDCIIDRQSIQHNSAKDIIKIVKKIKKELKKNKFLLTQLINKDNFSFKSKKTKFDQKKIKKIFLENGFKVLYYERVIRKNISHKYTESYFNLLLQRK